MAKQKKNRLLCLKENGFASSTTINAVLYIPKAKANLLFLGQLGEQEMDMKTIDIRMYLQQKRKKVMINSNIGRVWLINSINQPMKALSTCEIVKKSLKKGKNDLFYACLGHMVETYNKKIISIVDDIDSDPTKICFYKSCISIKITINLSIKTISEITTKLGKVHINFWRLFLNISLGKNCYIWTITN